ncbi:MAG: choice-of-anchor Q domain-containing protein, partial [Gammaproteobacteria bacterium]
MIHSSSVIIAKQYLHSQGRRHAVIVLCLAFILPFSLLANTITVNTKKDGFADDGFCTLAEAIVTANSNSAVDSTSCAVGGSGNDTIEFVIPNGTIRLTGALPPITESLTIKGPGPDKLTLDGDNLHRVFFIDSGGNAQSVDISGLTIRSGKLFATSGAAISVTGDTLNLSDCVVSGNSALAGGGIFNSGGTVFIRSCTISGNTASATQGGGNGGGINNAGTMTLENSTVANNSATHWGGGIFNGGTLTILNSTISGNDTPSFGGGIYHNGPALNIANSTISGNSANESGGGLFTESTVIMNHVTITDNIADNDDNFAGSGGGITIDGSGFTVAINNSIVASNKVGSGGLGANRDCSGTPSALGTFSSGGNNLFGDLSGCAGAAASDLVDTAPLLAALADNGGPSATHALLPGSPALEAIAPSACLSVSDDQRSVPRPQDGNNDGSANCDIGAYEQSDPDNVDLVLAMDDGINAVTVGGDVTWVLTVSNRGPASANNVVLTNVIPAETTFVSATPAGSCALQADNRTVICDLGTLSVGGTAAVSIVATTNSIATILNTASVSRIESEIIAGDNTASEETLVQAANTPPVAVDDAFETVTNVALTTGNVIDNDEDIDGDALFIS